SKWGVLTQAGKIVVPPKYTALAPFSEGLAAATSDTNKIGYINSLGRVVIPFKYSAMGDFKNGLAFTTLEVKPAKRLKNGELQFSESR
ncbi:WG repeat-containing protein, partial [Acinetobacter baumannii]